MLQEQNNQKKIRRIDSDRKENMYKESNQTDQFFKNKSKDRDINFLVMFSSSKA